MDSPDLLSGSLPVRNVDPVEIVDIVQHSRSVYYKIILTVVYEDPLSQFEQGYHITSIAFGNISRKLVVDAVIAWNKVNIFTDTKTGTTGVKERDKGFIRFTILSEVEGTHASPVVVASLVVICNEIEIACGLDKG
jgi:hypothetical protein